MNKTTFIQILRWIGVLPITVIAPLIVCVIVIFGLLFGDLLSGDLWIYFKHPEMLYADHFFTSFVISAVFGYIAVAAGAMMAPSYKRAVAFSLFGIIAMVFGFVAIISLLSSELSDSWRMIVNSLICIITSGIAAFTADDFDV